jgi:L-aminopeptidase/D-esterase-like protein
VKVGHASDFDAITGVTVILAETGAVGGVDIRGSATGTEEMDVLRPDHVAPLVHAIVLAGGSAFGLEAASGVRRFLERKNVGFPAGVAVVPIVPCAVLFDLGIGKAHVRPTREMGEVAAAAAHAGPVEEGSVGAGTGATVGKLAGMRQAMKGGIGSWTVTLGGAYEGVLVSSLVAVNALGDVCDASGRLVAGMRRTPSSKELAGSEAEMKRGATSGFRRENTTLAVVATNARLNRVEAGKLARLAQLGMARSIRPVNTMSDGDVVFALSLGSASASVDSLGVAAAESVAEAVLRAVRHARSLGGVPGLAG